MANYYIPVYTCTCMYMCIYIYIYIYRLSSAFRSSRMESWYSCFSFRGKILHTRNIKSYNSLENTTENPLDYSSKHPLDKRQSFGQYPGTPASPLRGASISERRGAKSRPRQLSSLSFHLAVRSTVRCRFPCPKVWHSINKRGEGTVD